MHSNEFETFILSLMLRNIEPIIINMFDDMSFACIIQFNCEDIGRRICLFQQNMRRFKDNKVEGGVACKNNIFFF